MIRFGRSQQGIVLILSLIMLMVLTLIAVSAIRLSTVNLRSVANAQSRTEAMSTAQRTVDLILSSNFTDNIAGTAQTLTVSEGGKNYSVVVARPLPGSYRAGAKHFAGCQQGRRQKVSRYTFEPLLGLCRHDLAVAGNCHFRLVWCERLDHSRHRYSHG
jgi:hypothetical protein